MPQKLTPTDIDSFISDGYLCIKDAFPKSIADEARKILWTQTGCDPSDRSTWTKPVVRLGAFTGGPFQQACNTPVLHEAFDTLVGKDRWQALGGLGTFPIRFPSQEEPGDDGWHIDMSFGTENPDFMSWRANFRSKGRALLLLFLFSDVGENDAPTRIRVGSHLDIARILKPAGEAGKTLGELAVDGFDKTNSLQGSICCRICRHCLPLPSFSCTRCSKAPWNRTQIHGSATIVPHSSV